MSTFAEIAIRTGALAASPESPLGRRRAVQQVVRAATSVQDARDLLDMLGLRAEEGR